MGGLVKDAEVSGIVGRGLDVVVGTKCSGGKLGKMGTHSIIGAWQRPVERESVAEPRDAGC